MGAEKSEQHRPAAALMERAKQGDRLAFGELYQLYLTPIFRYLFSQTKHRETAEDLTQTVFTKALQHLEKNTSQKQTTSEQAYFFAVARTTLIDFWRKKKEAAILDEQSEPMRTLVDERFGVLDHLTQEENQFAIEKGLALLNEAEREVLILRFLNDYSHREIAKLLGKSEAAIRQIQCRGLKSLRNHFATHHPSNV